MESDDSHIPIFLVGPEDSFLQWRSVGHTPDGSPLDFREDAFPDLDTGDVFHGLELGTRMRGDLPNPSGFATALDQQLGGIALEDRSKSAESHINAFLTLQNSEVSGVTFKIEHPIEWEGSGNLSDTSRETLVGVGPDFAIPAGRTYRLAHENLFPIETSFQVNDQQPLSAFSEPTTINSTPINSSCSESSRGRDSIWPTRSYPYPPSHQRGRSLSACGNLHLAGNRRRSSSDAYIMAGGSNPPDANPIPHYLDVPGPNKPGQLSLGEYMSYNESSSSADLLNPLPGRLNPGSGLPGSPPDWRHSQSFSPDYHNYQVQPHSPADDTRNHHQRSLSGVNPPIKERVASEAVKRAARKKQKNPGGKLFECHYCHEKLTTKQNLHYHTCAHLGIRDFPCKKCDKRFTTPHVQKRHEKRCSDLRCLNS